MNYKEIDMETFARKGQFEYFQQMNYPYVGMTVPTDITKFMAERARRNLPFFLTLLYAAVSAANAIPEFRQRIRGNNIVEFEHCRPSYTLALDKGNYCYCVADTTLPFSRFLPDAIMRQEKARSNASLLDDSDVEKYFFVSSLPWVSYTSVIQPVPTPPDSNPRITWGKFMEVNGQIQLPVSVLGNHSLMDGFHIAEFYKELQNRLENTEWMDV